MSETSPKQTPEQTRADLKRFGRIVQLAMGILDNHPETKRVKDNDDRVIEKTLDDFLLPNGKTKVWLRIGPSRSPFHPNQPVTSVTVEEQLSEGELADRKAKGTVGTAVRNEFFGDGKIVVSYDHSKDRLDRTDELLARHASDEEFKAEGLDPSLGFTIDTKGMLHVPDYTDWEHIEDIERTLSQIHDSL